MKRSYSVFFLVACAFAAGLLTSCGNGADKPITSVGLLGSSSNQAANPIKAPVFSYVDAGLTASSSPIQTLPTDKNAVVDGKAYQIRLSANGFYALRVGDVFQLQLPSIGLVTARITMREEHLGKVVSLAGEILGQSGSSVRLSGSGSAISGAVTVGSTEWAIRSTAAGSTIQNEAAAGITGLPSHSPSDFQKFLDQNRQSTPETSPSSANDPGSNLTASSGASSPAALIAAAGSTANAAQASLSTPAVIDVFLVSDLSYQQLMGSEANELADIGNIVNYANKALEDSQVFLRYRITAYKRLTTDATNSDHYTLLDSLRAGSGIYSGTWRDRVSAGADAVLSLSALTPAKGTVCGLAGVGVFNAAGVFTNALPFSASVSISRGSISSLKAFCRDTTFAHELGHNLGVTHDRANAVGTVPAFSYSYGYGISGLFGDIMSYLEPRVPYFSNPAIVTCAGRACGTVTDNAALTFNNTAPLVAAANDPDNRLTGWYYDPSQSGTGWAVEVVNGRMFIGGFVYRADGQPTWVVGYGSPCAAKPTSWCVGLDEYQGGQTLIGSYRPAQVARRIAAAELTFSSNYPASLALLVGGVQRNLQRYAFETSAFSAKPSFPGAAIGGWYYNPATPGTGVFTERQGDQVFAAYFYYRADGSPAWSVLNGKNWLPTSNGSFSGNALPFVNYVNGQTLLGGYVLPTAVANDTKAFLSVDSGGGFTVFNGVVNRAETWSKFKF